MEATIVKAEEVLTATKNVLSEAYTGAVAQVGFALEFVKEKAEVAIKAAAGEPQTAEGMFVCSSYSVSMCSVNI